MPEVCVKVASQPGFPLRRDARRPMADVIATEIPGISIRVHSRGCASDFDALVGAHAVNGDALVVVAPEVDPSTQLLDGFRAVLGGARDADISVGRHRSLTLVERRPRGLGRRRAPGPRCLSKRNHEDFLGSPQLRRQPGARPRPAFAGPQEATQLAANVLAGPPTATAVRPLGCAASPAQRRRRSRSGHRPRGR